VAERVHGQVSVFSSQHRGPATFLLTAVRPCQSLLNGWHGTVLGGRLHTPPLGVRSNGNGQLPQNSIPEDTGVLQAHDLLLDVNR